MGTAGPDGSRGLERDIGESPSSAPRAPKPRATTQERWGVWLGPAYSSGPGRISGYRSPATCQKCRLQNYWGTKWQPFEDRIPESGGGCSSQLGETWGGILADLMRPANAIDKQQPRQPP
ncbi:predicted protein [Chaetomium globosum CBS 148.51]|uniref:Uncharacterized protein n=1 Tax=Chaetomium globosum (strain ATCC 6205 / CBS 148.51 / DSM 1962 / NBRC 6347 / NRRL 1970) TaxID=306901 RepID=Q2H6F2_CHAGB|nr:uncharacterized protein CHGG_05763 [Chaetomium globosum CBS 148.51]EAQ89144.1 predicted protein [Chaetomium globosum CBS 148.51]